MTKLSAATSLATLLLLASPATARTDVQVHQTVLPDGITRYSVPVTVGDGPPIEAELDTGSFGLRVLKAALRPDQYEPTNLHRAYAFGGGAKLEGVLARAVLGVGPVRTDGPLLFQLVENVGCVETQPHCFASRIKAEDYRIAGDGFARQGFLAILGLSMRRAATDDSAWNPLMSLGDRSWILVLPLPGSAEPGHLVIDPDATDRAAFVTLQLRPEGEVSGRLTGWADAALPGCLVPPNGATSLCGETVLDSGAPGVVVGTGSVSAPQKWEAGEAARLEIGGAGGPVSLPFTSGGEDASRVILHPSHGDLARMSAGTLPFLSYEVLYDAKTGKMGFKPRDPAAP